MNDPKRTLRQLARVQQMIHFARAGELIRSPAPQSTRPMEMLRTLLNSDNLEILHQEELRVLAEAKAAKLALKRQSTERASTAQARPPQGQSSVPAPQPVEAAGDQTEDQLALFGA